MKRCTLCKKELPDSAFSLKKNSLRNYAKRCNHCNSTTSLWGLLHKEKVKASRDKFIKSGGARYGRLMKRYGITKNDYDRTLKEQNYKCATCGAEVPKGRWSFFSVDHDHKTNKVRGLLCTQCNRGIGYFHEDVNVMQNVINYLLSAKS
jgi:DNA-directed RNA polymerase subunit RPC12/RpoP